MDDLIGFALKQIDWEMGSFESLDLKAGSVLTFATAFAGLIAASGLIHFHGLLSSGVRLIVIVPFVVSMALSIRALLITGVYSGPDVQSFWAAYQMNTDDERKQFLLADLHDAIALNVKVLERKETEWRRAAQWSLLGVFFTLIAVGISVYYR